MDSITLLEIANELRCEIAAAVAAGYPSAEYLLGSEAGALISQIQAGTFVEPVELKFTAGPYRLFSETPLGECRALEAAWYRFCQAIEGNPYRGSIGGNAASSIE